MKEFYDVWDLDEAKAEANPFRHKDGQQFLWIFFMAMVGFLYTFAVSL